MAYFVDFMAERVYNVRIGGRVFIALFVEEIPMRVKVFTLAFSAVFAEERYYVCVSSFLLEKNADAMVSLLNESGLSAFKVSAQVSGRDFFRVLVGVGEEVYSNAAQAKQDLQQSDVFSTLKINGNFWVCKSEPPVVQGNAPERIALEKNDDIPLSAEKPYSVLVRSYGEEQKAKRDEVRLEQEGVDAYMVKKYDEERLFLFDLHAGAFADEDEARELQQHIEDIGITGTRLSDYDDIKQSVDEYERRVASQTVYTDRGVEKIPASLSDSVKECMGQFLVLPGFEVESVLVCDLDSARKNSEDSWQNEDDLNLTNEDLAILNAFLFVSYKDELFGKKVGFIMGYSKDAKLKLTSTSGEAESGTKQVRLPYGLVDCTVTHNEDGSHVLTGFYGEGRFLLALTGEGFEGEEFYDLLAASSAGESLAAYPQIRKTLFVMPDSASGEREFVYYTLSKVDESYAVSKGNADWAKAIVGHWSAHNFYFYKAERFDVAFFELDYDFNADYVHGIFMADHEDGIGGHSQKVGDKSGWFVYNLLNGTELSFAQKSYIIALDSYSGSSLVDGDFLSFASLLQIWHTPEPKTAQRTD